MNAAPRTGNVERMTGDLVDVPLEDDPLPGPPSDRERWLEPLAATGTRHVDAVRALHELLVRAATYEVRRRAASMGLSGSSDLEDLAMQAADDALVAILARLDSFEGRSAFTTWAYKFAIHTAGVAVRRLAWRGRDIPSSGEALDRFASRVQAPDEAAEQRERLERLFAAIQDITPRQREVVLALCISEVPIDVLADRLGSSRGAIYKTLHDARRALRARVGEGGHYG